MLAPNVVGSCHLKEEDLYGWFMLGKPMLGVNNLDLIKDIFVKDFNHFVDRNADTLKEAFKSSGDLDKVWYDNVKETSFKLYKW
jgi:hypothetical protein